MLQKQPGEHKSTHRLWVYFQQELDRVCVHGADPGTFFGGMSQGIVYSAGSQTVPHCCSRTNPRSYVQRVNLSIGLDLRAWVRGISALRHTRGRAAES